MTGDLSIYLVTDTGQCEAQGRSVVSTVKLAVAGGVTAVQVRAKDANPRDFLDLVSHICAVVPPHVAVFVNDRVDVFLAARARGAQVTGVHLGQHDLSPTDARQLIGPEPVIGLSASTQDQLREAESSPARIGYVGIGPVWPTLSKDNAPEPLGFAALAALIRTSALPVVAIGGLSAGDLAELRALGVAGAAVVSAICASDRPDLAANQLVRAWKQAA